MATRLSTASSRLSVDSHGRAFPMSEEEIRARALEIARGLDSLDEIGDEHEQKQSLDALLTALDAGRPSGRKLFS